MLLLGVLGPGTAVGVVGAAAGLGAAAVLDCPRVVGILNF